MTDDKKQFIGFTCAYTPLPLIDAAGFVPFRILPVTEAQDQAGSILHDNMCPHVKRVLDRAMAEDLPDPAGVVFMNSCESMRRLIDGWRLVRPADRTIMVDIPSMSDDTAVGFFAGGLERLWRTLLEWSGRDMPLEAIGRSVKAYNELALKLAALDRAIGRTGPTGGRRLLQKTLNLSVTRPMEETLAALEALEKELAAKEPRPGSVPVYLFGNVLPDEEAFELLEKSGCRVAADSLCTGSRQIAAVEFDHGSEPFAQLARALLDRPPCARTIAPSDPGMLAGLVLDDAQRCGAKGVIAHVMKFCDPYLARLPFVREALKEKGMPMLVLEGDCTLRSLGQHRTRIEAFAEMLGGK